MWVPCKSTYTSAFLAAEVLLGGLLLLFHSCLLFHVFCCRIYGGEVLWDLVAQCQPHPLVCL